MDVMTAQQEYNRLGLITQAELENELGVSRTVLYGWRTLGMPFVLAGARSICYRLSEVSEWLTGRGLAI